MPNKTIFTIVKREKSFVQVDKETIEDKSLSWKARGILIYLLGKPDDWRVYISELDEASDKDGETSLRSGLKELEEKGYIKKIGIRDKKGKFVRWQYLIFECPELQQEIDLSTFRFSRSGEPSTTNIDNTNKDTSSKEEGANSSTKSNSFGNEKINNLLSYLKESVGIDEFCDSQKWIRSYAHMCLRDFESATIIRTMKWIDETWSSDPKFTTVKTFYYACKKFKAKHPELYDKGEGPVLMK